MMLLYFLTPRLAWDDILEATFTPFLWLYGAIPHPFPEDRTNYPPEFLD